MFLLFFFFKQKTAYEMRISDWSSDVCSSDLALGYRGAKDLLAYLLDPEKAPSEGLKRVISKQPKNLRIRPLDKSRYREDIGTITAIFNDAWSQNWGFVPYTEAEVEHLASALKPLLDPQLVPIAELDGEPVAFGVALPNLNEAIRDFDGKLLPFNWAKLLWRLKVRGVQTARVPLMGVRSEEHTSELQSLTRTSYAVVCLKTKTTDTWDEIET